MGAPTDRPDDPNIGARAVWLGQVSEAASALAAAQVPEQLSGSARLSKISVGSSNVGSSITVTPARDVLLDPDVPPAPPSRLRSRLGLTVVGGLVGVILAVAIAAVWRQLAIDRTVELASSSARPAPARAESAIPRLIVQSSRAMSGEPALLGLALQGWAEGAVVIIRGLVGMELSAGDAVGADAWQVPATDLSDVWISPPESFVGSADLVAELRWADDKIADRQAIHVEWAPPVSPAPAQRQLDREDIAATPPVSSAPAQRQLDREEITAAPPVSPAPAQRQLDREEITAAPPVSSAPAQRQLDREENTATPPISPAPAQRQLDREEITAAPPVSPAPAQRQLGREEITVLLNRGKHLIANGDLAAARLVLQRAAEANDAEAALALAATYDPIVLRELKVYGLTADAAMARAWYQRARELGSAAALQRLEMLTTGAR
jgi:hypothetical protein